MIQPTICRPYKSVLSTTMHKSTFLQFNIYIQEQSDHAQVSQAIVEEITTLAKDIVLPPLKHNLYFLNSKYLGPQAFTIVLRDDRDGMILKKALVKNNYVEFPPPPCGRSFVHI